MARRAGLSQNPIRFQSEEDIVQGRFDLARLASGIVVHTSDLIELASLDSEREMEARLTFLIVLDGVLEITLAGRLYRAGLEPGEQACCLTLPLTAVQPMQRCIRKGRRIRKVTIVLERAWFEQQGVEYEDYLHRLGCQPDQPVRWTPPPKVVDLAHSLLAGSGGGDPLLQNLAAEQSGLALAIELLQALQKSFSHRPGEAAGANEIAGHRMRAVISVIEARNARLSGVEELAGEVGMSVSALQRLFKKFYGTTVADYLRQRRLIDAREAMEREGLSIGEAAFLAGYNHPSNFISAFRRSFGKTPGQQSAAAQGKVTAARNRPSGSACSSTRTGVP